MAQITSGIRSVLSNPVIYDLSQNIMGAKRIRSELVQEFIRPKSGQRILDIGCGTAEILSAMPLGVEYVGFDISEIYIQTARQRFGSKGAFHLGLFDKKIAPSLGAFDTVIILGALHHMDDRVVDELFSVVSSVMKPDGRVVTIDPCFDISQGHIAKFLISRDRGRNVRTSIGYASLSQDYFSDVKGVLRHRAWIPYTHWIMECKK